MPIAHLTERAALHIGGADARPFLQGLLTNDLDRLAPERPLWAALLSAQGKVLFDLLLFDDGAGGVLIDVEAARADDLARRLTMYRLRRAVTIARSDLGVFAAWDKAVPDWPADPRLVDLGRRAPLQAVATTANSTAYRVHRMALGVPEGSDELGIDKTLWLEANAAELHGVSFTKGCYVGQENTARMHYRANVRRRLLPVTLATPPAQERAIFAGERSAGELRGFEGLRGIAHLRLEYLDTPLTLGGEPIRVSRPSWLSIADEPAAWPADPPEPYPHTG